MALIARYRKRPVVIEATHFDSVEAAVPIASWCGGKYVADVKPSDHTDIWHYIAIPTLEGVMQASLGDWIIRGVQGEFYPCKPKIFEATYELAHGDEDASPQTPAFHYASSRRFTLYRRNPPAGHTAGGYANAPDQPQLQGVVFADGSVVVRWLTEMRSTSVWPDFKTFETVHGHPEYDSELVWHDNP